MKSNQNQYIDKNSNSEVTPESLVLVFFTWNLSGRNASAIYCWKDKLMVLNRKKGFSECFQTIIII